MKKMNNKGFAISTLIYGLSIMGIMIVAILMATMAQTRSNNSSLAKSIEEDLNRYSRTETSFKPRDNTIQAQEYIVPESGWYKIELWGTQGKGAGGKGAYTSGVIELQEGEVLYFYVGKHSSSQGGYETDVRLVEGSYTDFYSYETRIMVAAGGGDTATSWGGTLRGYDGSMTSFGGFIKSKEPGRDFSLIPKTDASNTTNGTLVGFTKTYAVSGITTPTVGSVVPAPSGIGGDGYGASSNIGVGGASFIAGYAGSNGISQGKITTNSKVEHYEHKYTEANATGVETYGAKLGEYYFVDGMMMPGVHEGDGYAKIERVRVKNQDSPTLIRKNTKFNGVRYIKDCAASGATWSKIVATVNGNSIEKVPGPASGGCVTVDLGGTYNVDEIAVFHGTSGVDYVNNYTQVSANGSNWTFIKNRSTLTTLSETETVTGYRMSAYQYDPMQALPAAGNYIIQPVLSENKVLSAAKTTETNADPISIEPYNGEKRQKWSIELITDTRISPGYRAGDPSTYEYKIVELARFKALSITHDENMAFNTLSAIDRFNDSSRNEPQIWKIRSAGNGTYIIETSVPQINPSANTGYILPQTNSTVSDALNQVIIGTKNAVTARFKLIQIDYSSN